MTRSVPAAPKKCQEVPEDNAVIQNKGDVVPSCERRQCSLQDIKESKYGLICTMSGITTIAVG